MRSPKNARSAKHLESVLAASEVDAQRWRTDYFAGLVCEDVLEFSRLLEVNATRVLAKIQRSRVGSPLSRHHWRAI